MDDLVPSDSNSPLPQYEPGQVEKPAAFLSIVAAAEFLGVGKGTVEKWSSNGLLESCKCHLGRRRAFLRDCLRDLVDQGKLDLTKKSNKRGCPSRAEVRKSLVKYINQLLRNPQFREKYGERISTKQLVEMLPVKLKTVREWSSRGLFDRCKKKVGRQLSILLECFLRFVAHDGLDTRAKPSSGDIDPSLPHVIEMV